MTLSDLFGPGQPPVEVDALALDDREVRPGTAFFCVPGFTRDGHDFAPDAVAAGASALVVERELPDLGVPQVLVPDVRAAMAPAAAALAGDPTATLRVAGTTGTNGKTTTSYLLRGVLAGAGCPCGMLGTVESVVGGVRAPTVRTTPEALELQRTFRAMLDAGDTHCAMEVSSHALALHRADAIHWAVVGFTNLSRDHLDFHADLEEYFQAKRQLLVDAGGAPKVVNADDAHGRRLLEDFPDAIGFGFGADAQLRATDVALDATGGEFTLDGARLRSPLPGDFNVLNALAAVGMARALGVDDGAIARALPDAGRAPGRFEPVDEGQPFAVLVDYAHTPDGLDSVLRAARGLTGDDGRVIAVFGAGGDRDRAKRPHMGAAGVRWADELVLTSDNPRSEDPEAILADVATGAPSATRITDRREAVAHAVGLARAGDVVVIAGKGHEQGQELAGGVKVPFDDRRVAAEALRALGAAS